MSVVSEIERIKTNIANAYTEIENKGVVTTGVKNSDNLATTISAIQTGGTGGGSTIEKGVIVNACDDEGYITDVTVVGITSLPANYFAAKDTNYRNGINYRLKNVNLPNNLRVLGSYAFYYCSTLELNSLPESITSLGTYTFYGNSKITLKRIPSGVKILGNYVFNLCGGLTELTIEGDLTTINNYALSNCANLSKIVMPNLTSVPELKHTNAFNNMPISKNTGYIYVPDSLVEEMKIATNWSTYATRIKGVSAL